MRNPPVKFIERRAAALRRGRSRREMANSPHELIAAERQRQIKIEGWTADHDDAHPENEMLRAGLIYYYNIVNPLALEYRDGVPAGWPWHRDWWKPKDPVRDLVRAGALCVAEIDRDTRTNGTRGPNESARHSLQLIEVALAAELAKAATS